MSSQKLSSLFFLALFLSTGVLGGVVYNPNSVCYCQGADNMMYRCLCPMDQPEQYQQSRVPSYGEVNYPQNYQAYGRGHLYQQSGY